MNIKKIVLVISARYTSNMDVITGFDSLDHAQKTMLDMVNAEGGFQYPELEDNYNCDTAENCYVITESRNIDNRTDDEIADEKFFNFIFDTANDFYEPIAGKALPNDVCEAFRNLDIHDLDALSDDGGEFDELEWQAFEHALETNDAIENKDGR